MVMRRLLRVVRNALMCLPSILLVAGVTLGMAAIFASIALVSFAGLAINLRFDLHDVFVRWFTFPPERIGLWTVMAGWTAAALVVIGGILSLPWRVRVRGDTEPSR